MADINEQVIRLIQGEHTDALERIETEASARALKDADDRFTALARATVADWTRAFGGPRAEASDEAVLARILRTIREAIERLFDVLGGRARAAMDDALLPALALGAAQGAEVMRLLSGRRTSQAGASPSRDLRRAAGLLPGLVDGQRRSALALLAAPLVRRLGLTGALAAVGRARGVVGRIRAHISWTVSQALNEGLIAGIRAAGAAKLWVAERDACTSCLAYAGLMADVGEEFPGGLDWDPSQRGRTGPVEMPPRHPHCRCRCVAWREEWARPGELALPEALRREARRSVARGWSLPSESNSARVRAAGELLRTGTRLPASVREFAAAAVRAGRFEDRNFPAAERAAG